MIINKYTFRKDKKETIPAMLSQYKLQTKGYLSVNKKRAKQSSNLMKSSLAAILPFAAASLCPFVLQAQACPGSPAGAMSVEGLAAGCNDSESGEIDLDGGGVDVVLLMTNPGFSGRRANGLNMTFARTTAGPYRYFIGYDNMDVINSASGFFGDLNPQPGGLACGESTDSYGWLDYQAFGTGGWNGLSGTSRFMGLIKDNKLGFIEIFYTDTGNGDNSTMSIGSFGLSDQTITTLPTVMAGVCSSILPVELVHFFGKKENDHYILNWQTASEVNNEGFEVQRSTDGENFRNLGWIDGVGNSNQLIDYSYEDTKIAPNQAYYYRLKQVDFDGRFEYSNILTYINVVEGATTVKDLAPNPINADFADLRIISPQSQGAEIAIYDAMGQSIFDKKTTLIKGMHTIRLDLGNAQAGTHFVRVLLENGESYFKKLVVAK